eukprot:UN02260
MKIMEKRQLEAEILQRKQTEAAFYSTHLYPGAPGSQASTLRTSSYHGMSHLSLLDMADLQDGAPVDDFDEDLDDPEVEHQPTHESDDDEPKPKGSGQSIAV